MENIIIGRNPILEAIRSGRQIDKLMVKKGKPEGSLIPLIKKAREKKIVVQEVEKHKLDSLSDGGNHQGVIAVCAVHDYVSVVDIIDAAKDKGEEPLVVICDRITDPHNLGAIIRSANCAGAHGVIIPKNNSAGLNEAVAKTAAGALEYTPVARVTNLARTIDDLKKAGLWIAGADMDGGDMYESDLSGALGIVIGSEGEGISRLVKEKCDFIISIPMMGQISSLNASVAAGVMLYEAVRRRRVKGESK